METLPKELTPELLSLVTGNEVESIKLLGNTLRIKHVSMCQTELNIDTLIKQMKAWSYGEGYGVTETPHSIAINTIKPWKPFTTLVYSRILDVNSYSVTTEEIIKAIEWVAKKRGLIK